MYYENWGHFESTQNNLCYFATEKNRQSGDFPNRLMCILVVQEAAKLQTVKFLKSKRDLKF